jgi:archaellum component FlaC
MASNWKDQTLADAFMQKAESLNIRLFPETALQLAEQIRSESEANGALPVNMIVKQKADQIFGNKDADSSSVATASVEESLSLIFASFDHIVEKFADQSANMDHTEVDEFLNAIEHEVFIPFKRLEAKVVPLIRSLMVKMKQEDANRTQMDKEWILLKEEADKLLDAWTANPTQSGLQNDYEKYRLALKRKAAAIQKSINEYNLVHSLLIFLNKTEDSISKISRSYKVQSITSKSGASSMLKSLGIDIRDLKDTLVALRSKENRRDPSVYLTPPSRSGKDLHTPIDMLRLQRGPQSSTSIQDAAIGPNVDSIEPDEFFKSPTWEKHKALIERRIKDNNPNASQAEIDTAVANEASSIEQRLRKIDRLPQTWQKGQEIYKLLDPASERTFQDTFTASYDSPLEGVDESDASTTEAEEKAKEKLRKSRWVQVSKKQPAAWSESDIDIANQFISTKMPRAWGETRKYAEANNPMAHHAILWAMADMNSALERDEKGNTGGKQFLEKIKEMKASDPSIQIDENLAKKMAAKYDQQLWTQRRNVALQVAMNPGTPDWILMYLTSVFPIAATGPEGSKSTKDIAKSFRIVREVAREMLYQRGWEIAKNAEGKPIEHEIGGNGKNDFGSGSFGYTFKRTDDFQQKQQEQQQKLQQAVQEEKATEQGDDDSALMSLLSSIKNVRIVTADNIESIDSQIANKTNQIATLRNQINQLEQSIKVLNDNKKTLAQEKQRSDQAAQQQQQQAATATTTTSPMAPATVGAPTSASYKVVYKKAAKF